jgi:hypothetical protein
LISLGISGHFGAAIDAAEKAAALLAAAAMPREAAYATMVRGMWEGELGSIDHAVELLERARAEFERLGDDYCVGITQQNLDLVASYRSPLATVEATRLVRRFRESVATSREWGDPGDVIANLGALGHVLIEAGEIDEAWSTALEAASLIRELRAGFHNLESVIAALARAAALHGRPEHALLLIGGMHAAIEEQGRALPEPRLAVLEAAEEASRAALDRETAARATAAGEAMSVEELLDYVCSLDASSTASPASGK